MPGCEDVSLPTGRGEAVQECPGQANESGIESGQEDDVIVFCSFVPTLLGCRTSSRAIVSASIQGADYTVTFCP